MSRSNLIKLSIGIVGLIAGALLLYSATVGAPQPGPVEGSATREAPELDESEQDSQPLHGGRMSAGDDNDDTAYPDDYTNDGGN